MKHYIIELLDNKDHVFFSTVTLALSITTALETAKEKAYKQIDKHKIIIRYVSVKDCNEHLVYNMLTKRTEKYY